MNRLSPYLVGLIVCSALVAAAEWFRPWRPGQAKLRPTLLGDLCFFVFNAHFLGVIIDAVARNLLLPPVTGALTRLGIAPFIYRGLASEWPVWLQIVVLVVVFDFAQWLIHRLLHAVPWLWELHKVHHSVVDGEMDWIVSFRFHWGEAAVYKALQYLPLSFLGFGATAVLVQALVGTLVGHLNHSNLDLGYGRWRYVINSPRMHVWHHNADGPARNFGIVFSAWDWIFGTAYLPKAEAQPARLGFSGDRSMPTGFLGRELWPLSRLFSKTVEKS